TDTLTFSLKEAGADSSTAFSIADYTVSGSVTGSTSLAQFQDDFNTYTTTSGSDSHNSPLHVSGNATRRDFPPALTGSSSLNLSGSGIDGGGAFSVSTTASGSTFTEHASGSYGSDFTLTLIESSRPTLTQSGTSGPDTYNRTQTA